MLVTVDKEDFVVKIESEKSDVLMLPCSGGWHLKAGNQPTMLPSTEFERSTVGRTKGMWMRTCNLCRAKGRESQRRLKENHPMPNHHHPLQPATEPLEFANLDGRKIEPVQGFKWKVTIIKRTEVFVYAKDFLDAGAEAGEGEIVKVERID